MKELSYDIKLWKKERGRFIKNYNLWESKIRSNIESYILRLSQEESHLIEYYIDLASEYERYGELQYIVNGTIEEYKMNLYVYSQIIELCQRLLQKGIDAFEQTKNKLSGGVLSNRAAFLAIIAGDTALALKLVGEKSFLGCILQGRYEDALEYQLPYVERTYIKQALMSIIYNNEQTLRENIEARIEMLRQEARLDVTLIDDFGLGILKLAKRRGMNVTIHVAELPEELMKNTPINFDKWQLFVPERVKRVLEC